MAAPRVVTAEVLDALAPDDPAAIRSRRDLARINGIMGSAAVLRSALAKVAAPTGRVLRVLELGAGDGTLMLAVAPALAHWGAVEFTLLDQAPIVSAAALARYAELGWTARPLITDVRTWIDHPVTTPFDVIVTNLFLHHFEGTALADLMTAIASRTHCFVAAEPRRAAFALFASRLVAFVGANAVTREDAVLSVKAGFRDRELSAHWPAIGWHVEEGPRRLFTHFFSATHP